MVVTNSYDASMNPMGIEVGDAVYVEMNSFDFSGILYAQIIDIQDGYKLFGCWIKENGSIYAARAFCNADRKEIFKVVRGAKKGSVSSIFSIRTTKAVLTKW